MLKFFTPAERSMILFFMVTSLLGSGIIALKKQYPYILSDFNVERNPTHHELTHIEPSDSVSLGQININTADAWQLSLLPGVGEKTAQKIIEYRQNVGSFQQVEEIMNVSGIGEKKFEKMRPHITINDSIMPVVAIDDSSVIAESIMVEKKLPQKNDPPSIVNINTATIDQLITLPGIGEKTAQKIIAYRQSTGTFRHVEDMMNVSGIGEKKFAQIRPFITVGNSASTAIDTILSPPPPKPKPTPASTQKINLNTATYEELQTLPGIGKVYAQRIIDYRNTHNGFSNIEEIMNIKGIAEKRFAKLKDLITVE